MTARRTPFSRRGLGAGADDAGAVTSSVKQPTKIRYVAAALSLAAALIHVWVFPRHYAEWWGYGAVFLVVALAQVLLSDALLYRPRRSLFVLGIAGNLAVIALWALTRTIGIPFFGPHAGEAEEVGMIDLTSVIAEVALVAALALLLRSRASRRSPLANRRDGV